MAKQVNISKVSSKRLMEELKGRGIFSSKVPPSKSGLTFRTNIKRWNGKAFKFGVVSCTHFGSKYQQTTHLYEFYKLCKSLGVTNVFHCGDMVDGEKMYRGQEYELHLHGADSQRDYTAKNYPHVAGIETIAIAGNHDMSFWKTGGYNIVQAICEKRSDMRYVGDYFAKTIFGNIKVGLMHATGGVPYARSYKPQKIVEQLTPDNKPHLLFIGHWHVTNTTPGYRNVDVTSMGCFQSQTPYLATMGLQPVVSGLIVEVQSDSNGMASAKYQWIPFFNMVENDY